MMDGRHPALDAIGLLPDTEIDLADAALQLGRIRAPDADWQAAATHLSEIARDASRIGTVMERAGIEARIGALAGMLHARHGYAGDTETYDDLDNANLIRVIERRRGLPVSLGILWLHCVRAAGWDGRGVDVPGHFLLQVDGRASLPGPGDAVAGSPAGDEVRSERPGGRRRSSPREQVLVDGFANGAILGMRDLAGIVRNLVGRDGELRPGVARPMGNRAVLLRLQRNVTQRLRSARRFEEAMQSLEAMTAIAPTDAGLWRDAAALNQLLERVSDAIACLERFLTLVPTGEAARDVRARLGALRANRQGD